MNSISRRDFIKLGALLGAGGASLMLGSRTGTGDWQDGKRFSSSASDADVRAWAQSLSL